MEAGEKIVQIECGYKHVLARDGIGKVFAWGNVICQFILKELSVMYNNYKFQYLIRKKSLRISNKLFICLNL